MRLNELLENNYTDPATETALSQALEIIKKDCQLFLKNSNPESQLVRGTNKKPEQTLIPNLSINNRLSSYSNPFYNGYLSNLMIKDGFKAARHNSLFCYNLEMQNKIKQNDFGYAILIYPIGNYSLTWFESDALSLKYSQYYPRNEKIYDLGDGTISTIFRRRRNHDDNFKIEYENKFAKLLSNSKNLEGNDAKIILDLDYFWNECKNDFHQGQNVVQACRARSEILLLAKNYHAIDLYDVDLSSKDNFITELYK